MLKALLFCISTLFIFSSISFAKSQDVELAKKIAKFHLGAKECNKAVYALAAVPFQKNDAEYISIYADTYVCKAGTKEIDLSAIDSANLFGSLAMLDASNEVQADSSVYQNLNSAIRILTSFDGTSSPDTAARILKFGNKEGTDLSWQALQLIFTQLGKFFALYGNTDPTTGKKGGGNHGNTCIFNYTYIDAVDYIMSAPGTCNGVLVGTEGSEFLSRTLPLKIIKTRMCQGIVNYNNMIDILANIQLPSPGRNSDVHQILAANHALQTAAEVIEISAYNSGPVTGKNAIAHLRPITAQAHCEAIHFAKIQKWYAILFETLLP